MLWTTAAFVLSLLPQLGDSNTSKIYFRVGGLVDGMSKAVKPKIGHAYKGTDRWMFYKAKQQLGYFLTLFDLDNMKTATYMILRRAALQFCRDFCPFADETLDMTVGQALSFDKSHLPFPTCIFLYVLYYNRGECPLLGGGREIKGYFRRLMLFGLESGISLLYISLGGTLDKRTCAHEWLYGSMESVPEAHRKCAAAADGFWEKLEKEKTRFDGTAFVRYLVTLPIQMIALAAWAPDTISGHVVFTDVVMNRIFGRGMWSAAFGNEHSVSRESGEDIYDASKYSPTARERAIKRIIEWMLALQSCFGIGALNTNDDAFEGSGMTAETLLDKYGWKKFRYFDPFEITVWIYTVAGRWPSLIFVHRPPCWMCHTKIGFKFDGHVQSWKKRAQEMYISFLLSAPSYLKRQLCD